MLQDEDTNFKTYDKESITLENYYKIINHNITVSTINPELVFNQKILQ